MTRPIREVSEVRIGKITEIRGKPQDSNTYLRPASGVSRRQARLQISSNDEILKFEARSIFVVGNQRLGFIRLRRRPRAVPVDECGLRGSMIHLPKY
jgi:hypothetical protein